MSRLTRGVLVAAAHLAIVMTLVAKYSWDRSHLPRVWAKTVMYDPNLPIRGRYVSMSLVVEVENPPQSRDEDWTWRQGQLSARDGRLVAVIGESGTRLARRPPGIWTLAEAVPFFIPEHMPDPSIRKPDEELWVEVSVPARGLPRPLRLALKKDGKLTPLDSN